MQPNEIDECRVRVIVITFIFVFVNTSAVGTFNSTVVVSSASADATTGDNPSGNTTLNISRKVNGLGIDFLNDNGFRDIWQKPSDNHSSRTKGHYYSLESEEPDAHRHIHTHDDETSRNEAPLQEVTGDRALPRDSTETSTEGSRKFTVNPSDVPSVHKDLNGPEVTKSESIFNETTSSSSLTLPHENASEIPSDQMAGTFSERPSKMLTNIYRDLPARSEKRTINVTTENFSNLSEVSAKGEFGMVGDQPKYLSAEIYNPYPRVATENAYIILHDIVSNPTERIPTQSHPSSGNSTEISSVQNTKDISEDYSASSCEHSSEEGIGHSKTSTGKGPAPTTEQLFNNRTGNGPNRFGKWNDTTRIPSRSTRDHSGSRGHRMETSKLNSSRNASDAAQISSVTAETVSVRQTNKRASQRNAKFPSVRAISSSTENVSRNPGGQLISITVQNSAQSSSISTESASKTSSDSTRNNFEGTTRSSGGDGLKKNFSVDSLHFLPLEHEPRIYLAAPSGVQVTRVTAVDPRNPEYAIKYSLDPAKYDSQFFQIHAESGNITTKRYIAKNSGEAYNLTVVATNGRDVDAAMDVVIRVAEYNRYAPEFETMNYTVELDVLTQVPTDILTVRAVDKDTQQYNSEVYYSVKTPQDVVTVNQASGVVTLHKRLSKKYKQLAFTISARDGGSPQRSGRTKLTITIKILSAPRDVTVAGTGDRWCMLCWKSPLSGLPLGYLILLHNNVSSLFRNVSVSELGEKNNTLCTAVSDLIKGTDYSVQVAGWNKDEVGITSAPIPFNTRVNRSCHSINSTDYSCSCLMGFYGDDCSSFNPCNSTEPPCQNGGLCKSNESYVFTCDCPEGYYGSSCEHFNPCSRSPCQHNSTCTNITTSKYKCLCKPGYTGNMCEVNINECEPYPCQNIATCIDGLNNFTCVCAPGFEGNVCEYNVDECKEEPCQNGGTCIDEVGSYHCKCLPGYEGVHCETNIDDCQTNQCENNGTCVDGLEDYYCNCQAGFEGDYCEDEINECMARPCLNGGTCSDAFNDFSCDCPPGYNGKRCEWDVDLCQSQPCQNNGECVDLIDHTECRCPRGYHGQLCEMKEQCPGELLRTDRGKFLWEPVPHGMVSTLPCPYGMSTNYTEHLEQLAHDSILELKYPDAIENSESPRLFKNPDKGNEDHVKHLSSVGLRADPVKLHAHLKDIEYKQAHEMSVSNQQKDRKPKLHVDEKGQPFAVRSCIRHKDGSVKWSNMDESICRDEHSTNAEQLSLELQQLTKDPPQISVQVFLNASSQIKQILHYALVDRKIAQIMFSVISNMMAVNDTVLEEADKHGSITKSLVQLIDTYLTAAQLPSSGRLKINSDNLAMEAREVFPDEFRAIQDGLSYSPPKTMNMGSGLVSETGEITQGIFISIPREALDRALRQFRSVRVQFVSYKNSKFFRPNNITSSSIISKRQGVISAALSNITITNLTELLVYNFYNIYGNAKQICVYWNTESQEWLDDGILTNQSMDFIQCESMHMTAFSVLLDPSIGMLIPDKHKPVLSIISYIGSVCSIFGLFLTILTYSMFRCLNRDRSGKILLNLCISLLLMNLAFLLVAIEEYMDSSLLIVVDVCTGVAVLTHYLVLTSLMWMLVEAINMYQLLITVFATSETKFMCKRMLCAWGIPLLIVGGAAVYDMQYYSSTDSEYCMVSPSKPILYYVTYLGPSCLILAVNCIVFILVSKVLFQRRGHGHAVGKVGLNTDIPTITVAQIRGAFTVMTLLGITWVFGALALGEARLVFQYIFCISNSLQGFIIFMVRCVQYPEARMAWLTFLHTGKLKKHRGPQGHGLPSSSAGNSHSRHTISSSTQSQSQLQGTAHLRSQSQSQIQSRLRSSHTTTTRKTSLPESSSCMSNSSGSGQGSLWNRFRQHESYHKTDTHVCSSWSFRSIFGSAHVPDSKQKPNSNSQKESEKGEKKLEGMMDGVFNHAIPLPDSLTRELKESSEERSSDLRLSQPVCCDPEVPQPSETDGVSGDLNQGGIIRSQDQETHVGGSQQSLTTKEGEDTSWQFMRAPPDGISESKATAVAESHTTSHSHSDQGYMSGACTAEHSPESPRQEPKQSLSCTVVSPIQPDTCHHDQRLTVSTPDHLYPDPKEETVHGYHNNMLTKSDSDITILLPKQDDDSRGPTTYVAIKDDMVYANSLMAQPSLVCEKNTVSSGIQHSGAGGCLIMESGLYSGGTNRGKQESHCMDHPPQPRPGYSSRRSSSTKSYSSSEGNNAGSSSSCSLHSESNSLEMAPRTMQLSAHRRPIHLHRHTKRIRCEEVL